MANKILTSWQRSDQGETEQCELSQFKLCDDESGGMLVGWQADISINQRPGVTIWLSFYRMEDYFFSIRCLDYFYNLIVKEKKAKYVYTRMTKKASNYRQI